MIKYFDFEKPIENIDIKISKLKNDNTHNNEKQIEKLLTEKKNFLKKIYSNLNAWQKVQVARHPNRPHSIDYINSIFKDFILLSGDKKFGEDNAIIS